MVVFGVCDVCGVYGVGYNTCCCCSVLFCLYATKCGLNYSKLHTRLGMIICEMQEANERISSSSMTPESNMSTYETSKLKFRCILPKCPKNIFSEL